jgi:hypothetical protein
LGKISFDEIEAGDRLRVSHVVGSVHEYTENPDGVTRSVASVAYLKALENVWLNADGHTVAHRSWKDLKIVRLEG